MTTGFTTNKTYVVTGASSGIGAATVRALRDQGHRVVAAARRVDRLQTLAAETGCEPVACDVTCDDDVARLAEVVGDCHGLVNNAGGAVGLETVADAILDDWQTMYDTNVLGAVRVTKALLPALRRCAGDVVVVTSTAALSVYEGGAGYCAAKTAEQAMAQTLRLELCGEPVRVIQVAPGMVATEEFSLVRFKGDAAKADAVYAGVAAPLTAADIAECIAWTLSRPAHVNIDSLVVRPVAQAANHKLHRG